MPCDAPVIIATRCALTMRGLIRRRSYSPEDAWWWRHSSSDWKNPSRAAASPSTLEATSGCQRTDGGRTMRIAISMAALVGGILTIAGAVNAEPPAAPYPLDAIPDKMPFSTPYGAPISLERAEAAIKAAVAEATKKGWPMNVAVVDSGGN